MSHNEGEWQHGLFGECCGGSCGTCMGAWCCAPCLYGRISSREEQFPGGEESPSFCNGPCFLMYGALICHLHWLVALFKRGDIRNKFGVKGDGCTDCLASYFCYPCVLAQMDTELKGRAKNNNLQPPMQQGYQPQQGGMTYQQPGPPKY